MGEIRFAIRTLLKRPALALTAILCLALGIGVNTAIFTVVNAVVLRPLAFRDPDRLVRVYTEFPSYGSSGGFRKFWMSTPELLDLRRSTSCWDYLEAYALSGVNLGTGSEPMRVTAANVTGGLMPMLGVAPHLGRLLNAEDGIAGVPLTLVLSDGLWRRAFAADPRVVGREVKINGLTATVIGVMPPSFTFPPGETDLPEIWYPQQIDPANPGGRANHFQSVLGKLKSGIPIERAREELQRIMIDQGLHRTPKTHTFDTRFHTLLALPYQSEVIGNVKPALITMLGAVIFVLLIACVNVGNLLLARAEARHHEIAIRKAIGASIWDLARQCLSEGLLISLLGAGLGLAVGWGALDLILRFNAGAIPRANEIGMDWRVLLFTAGAGLLTGLFFGLAPLAQFAGDSQESLKTATGRTTASTGAHQIRRVMVVSEVALALILLAGAGLMVRTFWKLQQVNIGLDASRVVTMRIVLPQAQYTQQAAVRQLWTRLLDRVKAIPAVENVSVVSGLAPLRPLNANDTKFEGYVKVPGGPDENVDFYQAVAPGYFEMLRIPIIEGRSFDVRDGGEGNPVVIVNRTLAKAFYGNQSPLGRRIRVDSDNSPWRTVVGVAADVKNAGIDKPVGTELYLPYAQTDGGIRAMYLAVKTTGNPGSVVASIRRQLADLDPTLPISQVRLLEDNIAAANARPRFLTMLLSLFSSIALILAALGIYGVMAFFVACRTQEFGIRMAVGAGPGNVLNLVLGHGMKIGLIGLGLGTLGALLLARVIRQLLFGIESFDPPTFLGAVAVLSVVLLAACYIPARRATRVDPIVALRYE